MRKQIILCLLIIPLLFTACARKADTDPDTVNILCYDYQTRGLERLYQKALCYDNSTIKPHYITENDFDSIQDWYEALHRSLTTHSSDIDIYCLDSTDEYAYKIIQDHYYVDLSQDDILADNFDRMYPEIREWCACGEELFGYPYDLDWNMALMVDEAQTRRIGYGRDDFGTVDDLIAFCDTWKEQNAVPSTEGYTYIYYYLDNYLMQHYDRDTGEMDLDNPQFHEFLTQCRDLSQPGAIFARPEGNYAPHCSFTLPVHWFVFDAMHRRPEYIPVPYPLIPGEAADAKRLASVRWMVINPYSKKTEEAMNCIQDMTEWAWDMDAHRVPIYRDMESYPENMYTQEQLDASEALMKRMAVGFPFPGYRGVGSACYGYIVGAMTLDEAAAEAQRILDTARQEQYLGQ